MRGGNTPYILLLDRKIKYYNGRRGRIRFDFQKLYRPGESNIRPKSQKMLSFSCNNLYQRAIIYTLIISVEA